MNKEEELAFFKIVLALCVLALFKFTLLPLLP